MKGSAALTFVYTSFPSVLVQAGLLHDFSFPSCGCDACDETWESSADGLEWTTLEAFGSSRARLWNCSQGPRPAAASTEVAILFTITFSVPRPHSTAAGCAVVDQRRLENLPSP